MVARYLRTHTNPPVFLISAVVIIGFVLAGVLFTGATATAAEAINSFITSAFGWVYVLLASAFVVFTVALMFTRYGRVKLGPDDSQPEFSTWAWFSMLFTAGMGIGLVLFGPAEPVTHAFDGRVVANPGSPEAQQEGMNLALYHWLLHPWAIYIIFAMTLGYFGFRRGLPLRPASALHPLIGDRIYGPIGNAVDILAVFGTMFGLATSLGLGASQVGAGLESVFGATNGTGLQIILVLAITAVATISVILGIDKGIRRLSIINMYLAIGLMIFVFLVGPTQYLLSSFGTNIGYYIQNLPITSFELFPGNAAAQAWQGEWTLFYWGWWISWSPFVGMFVARVSYGRNLREFIMGVLFAPVGASLVWFTVFGDTALNLTGGNPDSGIVTASADSNTMLYVILGELPIAGILATLASVLGMVIVVLFFATSSDSGSLVIDIITNGGDPNPVWYQRLFWALTEGVVAAVLLLVGGLSALQTASIVAGLPLAVVLVLMAVGLVRGLKDERLPSIQPQPGVDAVPPEPGRLVTDTPQQSPAPQRLNAASLANGRSSEQESDQ